MAAIPCLFPSEIEQLSNRKVPPLTPPLPRGFRRDFRWVHLEFQTFESQGPLADPNHVPSFGIVLSRDRRPSASYPTSYLKTG